MDTPTVRFRLIRWWLRFRGRWCDVCDGWSYLEYADWIPCPVWASKEPRWDSTAGWNWPPVRVDWTGKVGG